MFISCLHAILTAGTWVGFVSRPTSDGADFNIESTTSVVLVGCVTVTGPM